MKSQFGERIRALREKQNLYLRQVAPLLEMDTAQLSKIEKGLRRNFHLRESRLNRVGVVHPDGE